MTLPAQPRTARYAAALVAGTVLLLIVERAARAGPERDSLALDLPACTEVHRLADDLGQVAAAALPGEAGARLDIDSPRPGLVRIRLLGTEPPRESVFPLGPADCRELPKVVALLLRSWRAEDGWLQDSGGLTSRLLPSPSPSGPPPPAATAEREANVGVVGEVGAFFALGGPGSGFRAAASVERRLSATWGLAAGLAYDGPVRQSLLEGAVAVETWTLVAGARATLRRDGEAKLEVLFGPGVRLLVARTTGYERTFSPWIVDPVVSLAARLRQRVVGELAATAGVGLELCAARDVLHVSAAGPAMVVAPVRLNFAVGLAFSLD